MPEQASRRGDQVTASRITGPFENHLIRYGRGGLNLHDSLDAMEGWSRLTNAEADENGDLTARAGQTVLATGGTEHHTIRLLRDPQTGVSTRYWGIDANLYRGASGALAIVDAGYSGFPLTLVPHRPPLSGDPWMYVADRGRMRKVRADGLVTQIGLPAPGAALALPVGLGPAATSILTFDTTDASDAVNWTKTAGVDQDGTPTDPPLATDQTGLSGNCVEFDPQPGAAASGYDSWWGIACPRNLETLQGGAVPATDDDLMHFILQIDLPHKIAEIRLYLVVSNDFDPAVVPGTDPTGVANTEGYVKSIRQYDFARYLQREDTQINVAEDALLHTLRDEQLDARAVTDRSATQANVQAQRDIARTISFQGSGGAREWVRFGYFEIPLRRGDFQRFGTSSAVTSRDWGTVTGVVIYVRTVDNTEVKFRLDDWFLHGGFGIDSTAPGTQPYDWRYTHYDPRTGAESNPSPVMTTTLDVDRKNVAVTPVAFGDGAIRQRFYRRGGTLIDDWYFSGTNTGDGAVYTDEQSDLSIVAAGTVAIDHYQPVPTVDDAGNTVLAQPLPALWGPIEGMLLGCGDPYRPGHLYHSNADQPDHWSATGNVEVCPPSEELLHGGVFGHQAFVFSRTTLYLLYPNLGGSVAITAAASLCKRGPIGRWAFVVGPGGIYFVAQDGIFLSGGGPEDWISREIDPLFKGKTVNGYLPIDFTATAARRSLTVWENKLYFLYQDTDGARQTLVYDILLKEWRHLKFGRAPSVLQGEDEDTLLIGSLNLGKTYTHEGVSDDGLAIAVTARTGSFSGGQREEKLFGDAFIDADRQAVNLSVQMFLNEEIVANAAQGLTDGVNRTRYILDAFGTSAQGPQRAHSVATEVTWSSAVARPILYQLGYAITPQPDITNRRVTNWDDLGNSDEMWSTGLTLDVDTGNVAKTFLVERDFGGQFFTVGTFTAQANGRHKLKYSWAAVPANQIRIRPDSEACQFWILYRADWIWQAEPPRIAKWDIHFENTWDAYYTGLDLYCDTGGVTKTVEVQVDEVVLNNPATGLPFFPVTANGRRVVHLTLPWGRGHVFRFRATDDATGLLYSHRWHLIEEPSEQANWNQPFSILGSRADKWLKAVVFEVDTFNAVKSVGVEVDGVVVETIAVQANGRKVVQIALSDQHLGRVFRFFPADQNPSRLYTLQPVFDEEPFQLTRWETQETNHGQAGWFYPTYGHIVLKAAQDVTLHVIQQYAQETNRRVTNTYTLKATAGEKLRRFVTFNAAKGVLIKYILTSPAAFHLYREETYITIQPWGVGNPIPVQPFGNSDNDPTRSMVNTELAAAASGGGTK